MSNAIYLSQIAPAGDGTSGQILTSGGAGASAAWISVLPVANGGTGVTASTGTGNVVLSNSPTFVTPNLGTPNSVTLTNASNLPLTTGVTGILPVGNGGTGVSTFTANGIVFGNATSTLQVTAAGTTGQVLVGNTGAAPSWATLTSLSVSSISFGSTGLTPSSATSGAVTVAGTLVAANGGTGLSTFTAANNAIYSTSSSALTAGTLPILAGGTGATTVSAAQTNLQVDPAGTALQLSMALS